MARTGHLETGRGLSNPEFTWGKRGFALALRHVDVTLASNLLHGVREKLLATPPNGVKFDTVDLQQTFREPQSVGRKR